MRQEWEPEDLVEGEFNMKLKRVRGKEGTFFAEMEKIPLVGVVREEGRKAVVDERGRVERVPYELCVLVALRDALRRRETEVRGANR